MHCWYCNKVKGKRSCPAHRGDSICSRCCGTKRRTEIRCPDDCPYLHGEHDPRWEPSGRRTEDLRFLSRFAQLSREQVPFLIFFHSLLIRASRDLPGGLSDRELAMVAGTLGRTYQTLSKGIVYQHQSEDLKLQGVIARLGEVLAHRHEIPDVPSASDADVLAVLMNTQSAIETQKGGDDAQKSYIDIAERVFRASIAELPEPQTSGDAREGRLIVEP